MAGRMPNIRLTLALLLGISIACGDEPDPGTPVRPPNIVLVIGGANNSI